MDVYSALGVRQDRRPSVTEGIRGKGAICSTIGGAILLFAGLNFLEPKEPTNGFEVGTRYNRTIKYGPFSQTDYGLTAGAEHDILNVTFGLMIGSALLSVGILLVSCEQGK